MPSWYVDLHVGVSSMKEESVFSDFFFITTPLMMIGRGGRKKVFANKGLRDPTTSSSFNQA